MKINIAKLKKFLRKLPLIIAQHVFLTCLFLFFLALIFGGFVFYQYSVLAQKTEPEFLEDSLLLKEETYQEVLKVWQEHERIFQEADFKEYPDPFRKTVSAPKEGGPED